MSPSNYLRGTTSHFCIHLLYPTVALNTSSSGTLLVLVFCTLEDVPRLHLSFVRQPVCVSHCYEFQKASEREILHVSHLVRRCVSFFPCLVNIKYRLSYTWPMSYGMCITTFFHYVFTLVFTIATYTNLGVFYTRARVTLLPVFTLVVNCEL